VVDLDRSLACFRDRLGLPVGLVTRLVILGDVPRPGGDVVTAYPSVDESLERLRKAGWSVGETAFGRLWVVDGLNGENAIRAEGATQAEAWHRACDQAQAVGQLRAKGLTLEQIGERLGISRQAVHQLLGG
jgi:hypothetical protein